jgi:hypothetical protein
MMDVELRTTAKTEWMLEKSAAYKDAGPDGVLRRQAPPAMMAYPPACMAIARMARSPLAHAAQVLVALLLFALRELGANNLSPRGSIIELTAQIDIS